MKIFFCNVEKLSSATIMSAYAMLDPIKKARIDRCQLEARKKILLASDMLTRNMIGEFLNVKPESITFAHSSHEKPILPSSDAHFNVSHSGNYWVGCIDKSPCGIDIETIRIVTLATAKRFCNEEELNYINSAENQNLAFLTIWTRKEAYFKSIGCGIATVLSAVNVLKEKKLTTIYKDDCIISIYADENDVEIIDMNEYI